jgi:hypothetical protein
MPLVVHTVGLSAVYGLRERVVGVLSESCFDRTGVAERNLRGGAGVTVPGVDQVFQGSSDQAGGQVELVGDVLGAVLPTVGGLGGHGHIRETLSPWCTRCVPHEIGRTLARTLGRDIAGDAELEPEAAGCP